MTAVEIPQCTGCSSPLCPDCPRAAEIVSAASKPAPQPVTPGVGRSAALRRRRSAQSASLRERSTAGSDR